MNTELRQPIQMLGALRPVNVWNPDDAVGARARIYAATVLFSIRLSRRSLNAASATAGRERSPPRRARSV